MSVEQRTSRVWSLQWSSSHPRGAITQPGTVTSPNPDGSTAQTVVKLPLSGTAQRIICLMLSLNGSLTPLFLIIFDYPRTSRSLPPTEFPKGSQLLPCIKPKQTSSPSSKVWIHPYDESFLCIHISPKDGEWRNGCGFSQL